MQRRNIIAITALMIVALLGIGIVSANRFGIDLMGNKGFMKQNNLTDEQKEEIKNQIEAIHTAIADGDYDAWKTLMEERIAEMQAQITEENFNALVEEYNQREKQKTEMEEFRTEFCASHDCPNFDDEEFGGPQGKHRGFGIKKIS